MWCSLIRDWAIITLLILFESIAMLKAVTEIRTLPATITSSIQRKKKPISEYIANSNSSATLALKLVSPIIVTRPLPSYTLYSTMDGILDKESSIYETVKSSESSGGFITTSNERSRSISSVMSSMFESEASTYVENSYSSPKKYFHVSEALPVYETSSNKATSTTQNQNSFEAIQSLSTNSEVKDSQTLTKDKLIESSTSFRVSASKNDAEMYLIESLSPVLVAEKTPEPILTSFSRIQEPVTASLEMKGDVNSDITVKLARSKIHSLSVKYRDESSDLTPSSSIFIHGNEKAEMGHFSKMITVVKPSLPTLPPQLEAKTIYASSKKGVVFTSFSSNIQQLVDGTTKVYSVHNTAPLKNRGMTSNLNSDLTIRQSVSAYHSTSTQTFDRIYDFTPSTTELTSKKGQTSKTAKPSPSMVLQKVDSVVTSLRTSNKGSAQDSIGETTRTQTTRNTVQEENQRMISSLNFDIMINSSTYNSLSLKTSEQIYYNTLPTSVPISKLRQISKTSSAIKPSPTVRLQLLKTKMTSVSIKKGTNFTAFLSSIQELVDGASKLSSVKYTVPVESHEVNSSAKPDIVVKKSVFITRSLSTKTSDKSSYVNHSTAASLPKMEPILKTATVIKPSPTVRLQLLETKMTSVSIKKGANFTAFLSSIQELVDGASKLSSVKYTVPVESHEVNSSAKPDIVVKKSVFITRSLSTKTSDKSSYVNHSTAASLPKMEPILKTATVMKPSSSIMSRRLENETDSSTIKKDPVTLSRLPSSIQDLLSSTYVVSALPNATQVHGKSFTTLSSNQANEVTTYSVTSVYLTTHVSSAPFSDAIDKEAMNNTAFTSISSSFLSTYFTPALHVTTPTERTSLITSTRKVKMNMTEFSSGSPMLMATYMTSSSQETPHQTEIPYPTEEINETTIASFLDSTTNYQITAITSSRISTKSRFLSTYSLSSPSSTAQIKRASFIPVTTKSKIYTSAYSTVLPSSGVMPSKQTEILPSSKEFRGSTIVRSPESTINYQTRRATPPTRTAIPSTEVFAGPNYIPEKKFVIFFKIPSQPFTKELLDSTSKQFKEKKKEIEQTLNRVYENFSEYLRCEVQGFFEGSLGCVAAIFVKSNNTYPELKEKIEGALREANEQGTFEGVVTNNVNVRQFKSDEGEKKSWSRGPVLAVSILAGVCGVFLVIIITQCIQKRHYTHSLTESTEVPQYSPSIKVKKTNEEYKDEERIPMTTLDRTTDIY